MKLGPGLATLSLSLLWTVAAGGDPILHEYLPRRESDPTASPLRAGQLPTSIQIDGQTVERPPDELGDGGGPSARGAGGDRETEARLDRVTTHDGVLRYQAEFNPSVVPFKRGTALDAVGPGYVLRVSRPALRPLPITRTPTPPSRDAFWGSVPITIRRGAPVPIPSVAPEARILGYSTVPSVAVSFFRDSADNYWVRASQDGAFRLVFLTDAPRLYFSPQIPPTVSVRDVPAALRPMLPPPVRQAADRVLQHIGLRSADSLARQLDRLIGYFRSFVPGPLPRLTGDTYLDLALSQRGVCRHRSLAFVITAQRLGLPARYVHNEAHAFTEVFIPRLGWTRIDLGGASSELQVQDAEQRLVHHPAPDPFPRPSRYDSSYSQLGRNVTGLRSDQRLRRPGRAVSLRAFDRSRGKPAADERGDAAAGPVSAEPTEGSRPLVTSEPTEGADEGPAVSSKVPTQITLHSPTRVIFRGEPIMAWGQISQLTRRGGRGVGGLRLEIYLSRDGKRADYLLGATASGPDGRFRTSLPVPRGVPVGEYSVFAATPGDARHEASLSR